MMGHPSKRELKKLVHERIITSCPVTPNDVTNVYKIFAQDAVGVRGKATNGTLPEYNQSAWRYHMRPKTKIK